MHVWAFEPVFACRCMSNVLFSFFCLSGRVCGMFWRSTLCLQPATQVRTSVPCPAWWRLGCGLTYQVLLLEQQCSIRPLFCCLYCFADACVAMYAVDALRQLTTKLLDRAELARFTHQGEALRPFAAVLRHSGARLTVACFPLHALIDGRR